MPTNLRDASPDDASLMSAARVPASRPSPSGAQTSPSGKQPSPSGKQPSPSGAQPSSLAVQPSPSGRQPSSPGAQPSPSGAQPSSPSAHPSFSSAHPSSSGLTRGSPDADTLIPRRAPIPGEPILGSSPRTTVSPRPDPASVLAFRVVGSSPRTTVSPRPDPASVLAFRVVGSSPRTTVSPRPDPASVLAFCVVFALVLFLPPILNDGDTLWQIRTGEWILAHHAIPAADPFSFTAGDRPWFAHEWLAETLLALAWRAAGMPGVMVLAAAASGLTAAILLRATRRFLPGVYAILALIVALANAAPSMLARPHLLAWPCLALWCAGLVTARANRTAPSFLLLPVMLVWVNLHGSFIIGLLLAAAFLAETLFDSPPRRTILSWAGFAAAAGAVTLLNPEGLAGLLFPVHMVGMASLAWIGEWQPTDFGRLQPLELIILAGLVLGLSGKARLPPIRLLMLLGLIHGALAHARNEQLLGIAGVLILAEPLGAALGRGHAAPLGAPWRAIASGAIGLAAIALAGRLILPLDRTAHRRGVRRRDRSRARGGPRAARSQRVRPRRAVDLPGREAVHRQPRRPLRRRVPDAIPADRVRHRDALASALAEYRIAWTIFPAGHRVNDALDQLPGWKRRIEADGLVVHIHQDATAGGPGGG